MSTLQITVDLGAALDALQRLSNPDAIQRALDATADDVEDYIFQAAGKHTQNGALFRSTYKKEVPGGYEFGHDLVEAPYAAFVHWGTPQHIIRPKDKKALRWADAGKFHFSKEVHHPGYIGDPWLVHASKAAETIFTYHADTIIQREFNK